MTTPKKRIVLKRSVPYIVISEPVKKLQKCVRFSEVLEETVYFYKTQPPKAIQEKEPMAAIDYKIVQTNWSKIRLYDQCQILMEQVRLKDGDIAQVENKEILLVGECRVKNMSYEKAISIRYTFDLWDTFNETIGKFKQVVPNTTSWDRFTFSIPIQAKNVTQTVYFALRYSVDGQNYWDNNEEKNYKVVIGPLEENIIKKPTLLLSKRYDLDYSLISPPPSPPLCTPPLDEYTTPPLQKDIFTQLTYAEIVNKYCFYNSTPLSA